MKKKYYLISISILVIAIIAYHFFAAAEAEKQIDKAIQEQTAGVESIAVQYSEIDVSPFSGDVSIKNLTLNLGEHVEKAEFIQLDLDYLDFLRIYFGGINYGLQKLDQAKFLILSPSYVNEISLQEVKMDTLRILYGGNMLDGLKSLINESAFSIDQTIEAKGTNLSLRFPNSPVFELAADSINYSGSIQKGNRNFWRNGSHKVTLDSLIWTPPKSFQNTYRFFIQGFGYQTDSIPFQSARLLSEPGVQPNAIQVESRLKSELALLSLEGFINLEKPIGNSELQNMELSLTRFSQSFSQILQSFERLFSISLPRESGRIALSVSGTLENPAITINNASK